MKDLGPIKNIIKRIINYYIFEGYELINLPNLIHGVTGTLKGLKNVPRVS